MRRFSLALIAATVGEDQPDRWLAVSGSKVNRRHLSNLKSATEQVIAKGEGPFEIIVIIIIIVIIFAHGLKNHP